MQNYRKTSHTTYDCKNHIVWKTKYRKKVMTSLMSELVRGVCKEHDIEILKGHISKYTPFCTCPHIHFSRLQPKSNPSAF